MTILKMDPAQYSVSAEYLPLMLEMVTKRGVAPDQVLVGTGIDEQMCHSPSGRISAQQLETLVSNILDVTGEPWLGWEWGRVMNLSTHGFLGYAAMSSNTLGDACELAVKYFGTRSTLVQLEIFTEGDIAVIQISDMLALGRLGPFVTESMFSSIHFMGQKLLPDLPIDGELRFAFPEPDYFQQMRSTIPVPVYFDCAYSQLRFPAERLNMPLKFADERLARMAAAQCEQEMASLDSPPALLGKVRRIILSGVGRFPSVEEVASDLHMSSRTLKRKLHLLGTSYQQVLDDLRKGLAVEMLSQSNKTVDEIAMTLGYSDASNFARAFRRWTQRSPSDYRQ